MKYIIGIDEVGRGPLAGPVVLAAVCVPQNIRLPGKLGKLRDSKKLSEKQREKWLYYFKSRPDIKFVLARVNPRRIEKVNISKAANSAAYKACMKLMKDNDLSPLKCRILLDGGLYARSSKVTLVGKTIIKGDEKFTAIKIASILAKVQRDRYMVKLAKIYPEYGFDKHKGYATRLHRKILRKIGPSEAHRATFLTNII